MFVFVPGLLRDQTSGRRGRTSNTWVRGRRRRKSFLAEEFHLSGLGVPKPRVGTGRGNPRKHTNTQSRTHSLTHTHTARLIYTLFTISVCMCVRACACAQLPQITQIIYWILLFHTFLILSSPLAMCDVWYVRLVLCTFSLFFRHCSLFLSFFLFALICSALYYAFSSTSFCRARVVVFPSCYCCCLSRAPSVEIMNRTKPM